MSHYSKRGGVYLNRQSGKWYAAIDIDGKARTFTSSCRGDCESWLDIMRNGGNDTRFRHKASETPVEDIIAMGGTNPKPVPGFPHYYMTDEDKLYSVKGTVPIAIKPQRGKYLRLNDKGHDISCTIDRLRYCIDNNVSPTTLSRCKLSVMRGDGLQLVDLTEYIRQQTHLTHEKRWKNMEGIIRENIEWNQNLLRYYNGEADALAHIHSMLERRRYALEHYIYETLHVARHQRIKFIADETISETLHRIVNRCAMVNSPLQYMEKLSRHINANIRTCRGHIFYDNSLPHVLGIKKKELGRLVYQD